MKRSVIGNSDTTTIYIGKSYERVTTGSNTIHKNFIYAGSKVIAIKENSGIHYMHGDTQGNIIAISKDNGTVINRRSYTPFGEIRAMATKEGIANALNQTNITNRGYTGHEHLEGTDGLIHMNGRVYDATIGRFMSADPTIQAPMDTQSYNRYSYVRNNPVNLIDPSGYNWFSKQWKKWGKPILAIAVAAAIVYFTAGIAGAGGSAAWGSFFGTTTAGHLASAVAAGALAGGASSAIMTGSMSGTLKGALWGGIGGGVAFGIGHIVPYATKGGGLAKHLLHGLSRALISKAQGGTFRAGFYSGFASSAFNPGTTMGGDGAGGFGLRTTMAGVVGGTAAELGGGKFANGAVSGAFVHMFNAEAGRVLKNFTKFFKSTKIDDLLKGAIYFRKSSGSTVIYDRTDGGYKKALQDFDDLNLNDIKEVTSGYGGFKGKLDDGSWAMVRPSSKYDELPTIQFTNSTKSIKIRYRGIDDEPMHSGIGLFQ